MLANTTTQHGRTSWFPQASNVSATQQKSQAQDNRLGNHHFEISLSTALICISTSGKVPCLQYQFRFRFPLSITQCFQPFLVFREGGGNDAAGEVSIYRKEGCGKLFSRFRNSGFLNKILKTMGCLGSVTVYKNTYCL